MLMCEWKWDIFYYSVCVHRSTYIMELGLVESMLASIHGLPGVDCRHEVLRRRPLQSPNKVFEAPSESTA